MARWSHLGGALSARAAKKKNVSAKTPKVYKFAAAAADKKLAAAELASQLQLIHLIWVQCRAHLINYFTLLYFTLL